MAECVQYEQHDGVGIIRIDDGKRNAFSPAVLEELYTAFDQAEADGVIVIITGREGVFSAGFDLNVMKRGGPRAIGMLRSGYSLTARVLGYPHPVIVACNGHSFAMGVFLMLSADHVIGCLGDYRISANEVAIGLTMPRVGAAMLHHRLSPSAYQRAVTLSAEFNPESARAAGFFDELASADELLQLATERAESFKALDARAHTESKRRIRRNLIRRIRRYVWLDLIDAVRLGLRGSKPK